MILDGGDGMSKHSAFARGANPGVYGFVLEVGILVP